MGALLQDDEESPFLAVNEDGRSPYVLICEHASRQLPKKLGSLGLPEAELHCHLDGSLRPRTVLELAEEQGVKLPTTHLGKLTRLLAPLGAELIAEGGRRHPPTSASAA